MDFIELEKCTLCPRNCGINRNKNEVGFCKAGKDPKVALCNLHYFEEPCISGEEGSGTVFFTGCNLKCVFCQNYKISQNYQGNEIKVEDLANEFIKLQDKGANNINLVTAFMYVPQIIEAIKISRENGLKIPIVYNSSGYESVETIKKLEGYVDVYLPDLKYFDDNLAESFSFAKNYFSVATEAIKEMYRQVGSPVFDDKGMITKGIIIRHLVLPGQIENSKNVLKWIKDNFGSNVYVSVMAQYFPTHLAKEKTELGLNRKLTEEEYKEIEDYTFELDLNGFIQDLEDNEEQYVPKF